MAPAVAENVAELPPAAIETLAGTVRVAAPLPSVTVAPPVEAGSVKVTVQVELAPEARLAGVQETEFTCVGVGAVNVTEAVWELLFNEAVTTTVCALDTVPAVAVNVAALAFAATDTVAGAVSNCEVLETVTIAPATPAACPSVTVHVETAPETRVCGAQESAVTTAVLTPEETAPPAGSMAPIDGGEGRILPYRSVARDPVPIPAPTTAEDAVGAKLKAAGAFQ